MPTEYLGSEEILVKDSSIHHNLTQLERAFKEHGGEFQIYKKIASYDYEEYHDFFSPNDGIKTETSFHLKVLSSPKYVWQHQEGKIINYVDAKIKYSIELEHPEGFNYCYTINGLKNKICKLNYEFENSEAGELRCEFNSLQCIKDKFERDFTELYPGYIKLKYYYSKSLYRYLNSLTISKLKDIIRYLKKSIIEDTSDGEGTNWYNRITSWSYDDYKEKRITHILSEEEYLAFLDILKVSGNKGSLIDRIEESLILVRKINLDRKRFVENKQKLKTHTKLWNRLIESISRVERQLREKELNHQILIDTYEEAIDTLKI